MSRKKKSRKLRPALPAEPPAVAQAAAEEVSAPPSAEPPEGEATEPEVSAAPPEAGPPERQLIVSEHYQPFPRQEEFHKSKAKYRLFGGAAGPGKTKALLWEAIRQANEHPKVDTLLLRRTFPELESSLINYFRRDVPRDLYRSYNDSKHLVTWLNGSTTRFGYSAGENDIYQYQGAEFLFIGIDELTLFTLGQWQFLTSRNRCAVPGTFPNMAGASNPGNVGHAWVKALWVDKRPAPGMDRADQYDPRDYHFIRATLDDNPIYKDDAQYRKTLEALPRHLRQAFLLGDWNVFAGQYFDIFSEECICRAERFGRDEHGRGEGIASWWPRWISIDWGFEHPSAVYWHAAQPGGVVTYREFVANHLSPRMLAQAICERSLEMRSDDPEILGLSSDKKAPGEGRFLSPKEVRITEVFLSPDAFAHRTSESSIADQLGDVFAQNGLPRPVPADDDRVGGWMLMYQLLEEGKWVIADHCARLIECIPTLVRDPANVEDVLKMSGDDPADSARYGLKSRLAPGRVPPEQRVAERLDAASPLDMTSRAIWMQKFLADDRRSRRPAHLPSRWGPR